MASIGPYTVALVGGRLQPANRASRLKTRAGVPGTGVVFDAWRAQPTNIPTSVEVAADQGEATREAYRSMIEETVLVVDQFGVRWTSVLVIDVEASYSRTVTGQDRVDAIWTLLVQSEEPT